MECHLFKLHRPSSLKDHSVVGAKNCRLLMREDVLVRFAGEIPVGNMKTVLKLAIDLKIASFPVFEETSAGLLVTIA